MFGTTQQIKTIGRRYYRSNCFKDEKTARKMQNIFEILY